MFIIHICSIQQLITLKNRICSIRFYLFLHAYKVSVNESVQQKNNQSMDVLLKKLDAKIYTQGHPFQSDCFEIININNIYIDASNKHSYDYIFLFVFEEENSMN